ncbi:cochlin-like, partial [Discoglossus pictus]
MDLPITTFLIIILFGNSAAQSCQVGYAALVPCSTTLKELLDDITEVYCPAGCLSKNLTVWGTDIYPENSPICVAAIHAGLGSNAGGPVTVEKQPGLANYIGSTKNAITSLSYNRSASSFTLSVYPMTTSTTTTTPVTTAIATTT